MRPTRTWTVVVANTDGEGVFIRGSKQMADRVKTYEDGTELTVTGPEEEGEGINSAACSRARRDGGLGPIAVHHTSERARQADRASDRSRCCT